MMMGMNKKKIAMLILGKTEDSDEEKNMHFVDKGDDGYRKKDEYAPRKQKALAMENFKILASQYIVKFNQYQFGGEKK